MNKIFKKQNLSFFILLLILTIISLRIFAVFVSPLEISADESQYWLWSQKFQLGYFSKPPIISWVISFSTYLFGDSVTAIRFLSPLLHFFTALVLLFLFREIFYDYNFNYLIVPIIWLTLPIIGVGSFLISTDTPLMLIWSISLLFIFYSINSNYFLFWLLAGLFSGLAILAKYAGVFLVFGVLLYYLFDNSKKIKLSNMIIYIIGFIITSSPNIVWNINNNFSTISHLSDNAVIDSPKYSFLGAFEFLISQIFVIGPLIFLVFILSCLNFRKNNQVSWLLWFIIPVFLIILIQGFFSEANANWTATALPGIVILCGYFLQKRTYLSVLSISINLIVSFILILVSIFGTFGEFSPKSDPLRKLRGWESLSDTIKKTAIKNQINYTVFDRRGIVAPLVYYLKDTSINLRLLPIKSKPKNHYEMNYSLNPNETRSFIYVSENNSIPIVWDKTQTIKRLNSHSFKISKNKSRKINFTIIENNN